jgi:hypothetical protein
MNETTSSEKSAKWWKRALIGGFTSLIILIVFSLIQGILASLNVSYIILYPFYVLGFIFTTPADLLLFLGVDEIDPIFTYILTVVLFWFITGSVITLLEKNTKKLIAWWLLLLLIFFIIRELFLGY